MAVDPRTGQTSVADMLARSALFGQPASARGRFPVISPLQMLGTVGEALASTVIRKRDDKANAERNKAFADALVQFDVGSDLTEAQKAIIQDNPAFAKAIAPTLFKQQFDDPDPDVRFVEGDAAAKFGARSGFVTIDKDGNEVKFTPADEGDDDDGGVRTSFNAALTPNESQASLLGKGFSAGQETRVTVSAFDDGGFGIERADGSIIPVSGEQFVKVSSQETSGAGGARGPGGVTRERQNLETMDQARSSIASSLTLMNNLYNNPDAASGVVRAGSEFLGSASDVARLVGLGGAVESVQKGFTELFANTTPAMVREIATQARVELASNLEIITGDSSRYSDQDMARAREAFQLTNTTAKPEDALVAAQEFTILRIMRDYQFALNNPSVGPPAISVSKNVRSNAIQLRQRGMDAKGAVIMGRKLAERFDFYTVVRPFNPINPQ